MQRCPHCGVEIILKNLPHQGLFASHRLCPTCDGRFTVDPDTKYRQALLIVVALVALVFSILLYREGGGWLIPALASYAALAGLIWWGNRKVFLVPADQDNQKDADP